jgi:hypothetical protein
MLPGVTLPGSLAELLWALLPVFTAPSDAIDDRRLRRLRAPGSCGRGGFS